MPSIAGHPAEGRNPTLAHYGDAVNASQPRTTIQLGRSPPLA
jgi:hypothetical protein